MHAETGKKVLVTGATGRLGQVFVRKLQSNGWTVTALVRDAAKAKKVLPKKVEQVKADLNTASLDILAECMRGKSVVHLAATLDFDAPAEKLQEANVEATRRIVQAASAAHVRRLVHMSSTAIYHHPDKMPIDETQAPSPSSGYGETKWEAEQIVQQGGLPYVIIRAPAIYGPGFQEGFMQVVEFVRKGKMPVIGSGKNRIPLIHVDDAADALI
ncbi:MAG: NAD(P)-dependent oxidoreductase, partial [Candidatus Micrarchaeota archaeon]|nr:NAD(P)-dependent oxidoreductase [Candidatus Micrarchaeota archaeon]